MKRLALACLVLILGWSTPARAVDAPRVLAGIRLGDTVEEAGAKLESGHSGREGSRSGLSMVPLAPVAGFRSGYVDVGECAKPGHIVRVKMHYADDSLEFFDKILAALTKRYGEPAQWRGNAFGTLRTWKWSLKAADGSPVSLILMHYAGDDGSFTQGNSIRIADPDRVRQEQQCQAAKVAATARASVERAAASSQTLGLDWFLPH
jgi:hypothetical protein